MATLTVNALRNARRADADLVTQARLANETLLNQSLTDGGGGSYVTGILLEMDLRPSGEPDRPVPGPGVQISFPMPGASGFPRARVGLRRGMRRPPAA